MPRTMSFAMVETRAALEALDGILDTPGIDGIFLGPSDFSIAWSHGKTINAALEDMMATVKHGRRARAQAPASMRHLPHRPEVAPRLVDMGYRLFACGSEHQLIARGAEVVLGAAKAALAPK